MSDVVISPIYKLYGIDVKEWNRIRTKAILNGFDSPLKYVEHLEEMKILLDVKPSSEGGAI